MDEFIVEEEVERPRQIVLGHDQELALAAAHDPQNQIVFITGKAGSGKSVVLRRFRDEDRAIVLAPTGLAAVNVGGQTIHSFFEYGVENPISVAGRLNKDENAFALQKAKSLVIDEISMVRADMLDAIDISCRKTLNNDEPFGGKKLVIFGDPYQLEPIVQDGDDAEWLYGHYDSAFFFDAKVYRAAKRDGRVFEIELGQVFRQTDAEFISALDMAREGDMRCLDFFNGHVLPDAERPGNKLTVCLTNKAVAYINDVNLANMQGELYSFAAKSYGIFNPNDCPAEELVNIKLGARVMLLTNKPNAYANGDVGMVVGVDYAEDVVKVRVDRSGVVHEVSPNTWRKVKHVFNKELDTMETKEIGSFTQIPLKLAWAVTSHKSQGQTYPDCHICIDKTPWAHGQIYVALSRCASKDGLSIGRPLRPSDLIVNGRVTEWRKEWVKSHV